METARRVETGSGQFNLNTAATRQLGIQAVVQILHWQLAHP